MELKNKRIHTTDIKPVRVFLSGLTWKNDLCHFKTHTFFLGFGADFDEIQRNRLMVMVFDIGLRKDMYRSVQILKSGGAPNCFETRLALWSKNDRYHLDLKLNVTFCPTSPNVILWSDFFSDFFLFALFLAFLHVKIYYLRNRSRKTL